jgi:hypothetical protein
MYWLIRHQFHPDLFWSYDQSEGKPSWVYSVAFAKTFTNAQKKSIVVIPGSGIWVLGA